MRARNLWVIVTIVAIATSSSAQAENTQPISKYLKAMREEHAAMMGLAGEVRFFINSGIRDKEKTDELGQQILDRIASFRAVVVEYKNATTRFGLQEEIDRMMSIMDDLMDSWIGYGTLTGTEAEKVTEEQRQEARTQISADLMGPIVKIVDHQLGSHGLAEALTAESFEEVKMLAANKVKDTVLVELDVETLRWMKFGKPLGGFKSVVKETGNRLMVKYVSGLLVKLTSNSLLIEFASGTIVRWVGPVLQRALRNKGNLDARTARSLEVLETARRDLNALLGSDKMESVRMSVEAAERAIASTKFLKPDLDRAGRDGLYASMIDAEDALTRTIKLVRTRFLIGSKLTQGAFKELLTALDQIASDVKRMMSAPAVEETPEDAVAGTYTGRAQSGGTIRDLAVTVVITGTMDKFEVELKGFARNGELEEHWKATLKWEGHDYDRDADSSRYLSGDVISQIHNRIVPGGVRIEKGDDGKWRAERVSFAGGWLLTKQPGGASIVVPARPAA